MTTTETKPQSKLSMRSQGALLLSLALGLIFIGFLLDGITEYGHHALLIIGGMLIGIGIGKLKA